MFLWENCRKILCIRPDNMGDLIMTIPALRALKESSGASITVLISSMAAKVARMIPEIDDVIVCDVPWVKAEGSVGAQAFMSLTERIRAEQFDGAVVFTVYSQNPMPSIMLAWLAGIPRRMAYCRENPYELLTDWVADEEPYEIIKHQVRRDLDLVKHIGAVTNDERLRLTADEQHWPSLEGKLQKDGVNTALPWLILHPGVSEIKREYPADSWIKAGRSLSSQYQLLITGGPSERLLAEKISAGVGNNAFPLAGKLDLPDFILLIKKTSLVISVNTGTIHLAAALQTPMVVLYALTNPQHFPWKAKGKVLMFDVPDEIQSRNEVIRFVNNKHFASRKHRVNAEDVSDAVGLILSGEECVIPELPF